MSEYNDTYIESEKYKDFFNNEETWNRIEERIKEISEVIICFIKNFVPDKLKSSVCLNEGALKRAVLDYFVDIERLKKLHKKITKVNEDKIIAYECSWLLRRKPIQILCDDSNLVHINELFVVEVILNHLVGDRREAYENEKLKQFYQNLLYHLVYRNTDAKTLEIMIVAFKTARAIFEPSDKDSK